MTELNVYVLDFKLFQLDFYNFQMAMQLMEIKNIITNV